VKTNAQKVLLSFSFGSRSELQTAVFVTQDFVVIHAVSLYGGNSFKVWFLERWICWNCIPIQFSFIMFNAN
jgi:nitrate reductase NapE component